MNILPAYAIVILITSSFNYYVIMIDQIIYFSTQFNTYLYSVQLSHSNLVCMCVGGSKGCGEDHSEYLSRQEFGSSILSRPSSDVEFSPRRIQVPKETQKLCPYRQNHRSYIALFDSLDSKLLLCQDIDLLSQVCQCCTLLFLLVLCPVISLAVFYNYLNQIKFQSIKYSRLSLIGSLFNRSTFGRTGIALTHSWIYRFPNKGSLTALILLPSM